MIEALQQRLDHLKSQGGVGFDGPGLRFIEGLLRRATALDGLAAERLVGRATERLAGLEAAFETAQAEAREVLNALADHPIPAPEALMTALEQGQLKRFIREGRRHLRSSKAAALKAQRDRLEAIASEARARGASLSPALSEAVDEALTGAPSAETPPDPAALSALAEAVAGAVFQEATEEVNATVALNRAGARVPDDAGPYNPEAVVAQALGALGDQAPGHLRAWVRHLADLEALERLPAPPAPKRRRKGRR